MRCLTTPFLIFCPFGFPSAHSLSVSAHLVVQVRVFSSDSAFLMCIYFARNMQTPPNMNDQQSWGGQLYQQPPPVSSPISNDQPTLIVPARPDAPVHVAQPLSQAGFIASSSNNLFHPVSNVPPSSYVYSLPTVSSNPRYHTYNPPNTFHRPLPY